ncbi:MAG: hypothetical protein HFH53_08410 [Hespellia sp.]|jgi:cell division protein FtsL|nr:hypothetical protein [Hespellia sp.]
MASRRHTASYGRTYHTTQNRQFYVQGNTALRTAPSMERRRREQQTRQVSQQVRKNRNRVLQLNPAYVVFLTLAAVIAVFVCIQYLQLKSELKLKSEEITELQEELADLTEQNNTAYNAAADSINIEEIREKALNELGMIYPVVGQVIEYDSPTGDYVKQYEKIPENGAIAQSADVSN